MTSISEKKIKKILKYLQKLSKNHDKTNKYLCKKMDGLILKRQKYIDSGKYDTKKEYSLWSDYCTSYFQYGGLQTEKIIIEVLNDIINE
jgi:hypothetical protein